MPQEIHSYRELAQQIHEDLRIQHPEWIEADGNCPNCDEREARLKKLLESLIRTEQHGSGPIDVG